MEATSVQLETELIKKLDKIAEKTHLKRSQVIRQALWKYVKESQ